MLADTFTSTAVRSDYVISLGAYKSNFKQQLSLEVDVRLEPGITPEAGRLAVEEALVDFPNVEVRDRTQVLAAQEEQVNKLLVPVTALLALSVVIALLGIVNTLALSIHERTRELGLLRAVGMARSQLRSMVRSEAVIIAGLGSVLGRGGGGVLRLGPGGRHARPGRVPSWSCPSASCWDWWPRPPSPACWPASSPPAGPPACPSWTPSAGSSARPPGRAAGLGAAGRRVSARSGRSSAPTSARTACRAEITGSHVDSVSSSPSGSST